MDDASRWSFKYKVDRQGTASYRLQMEHRQAARACK